MTHMAPYGYIWPYGAISVNMAYMAPYGSIWLHMAQSGYALLTWLHMAKSGDALLILFCISIYDSYGSIFLYDLRKI